MTGAIAFLSTGFDDVPSYYQGSPLSEEPLDVMYAAAAVRQCEARIIRFDEPGRAFLTNADVVVVSTTNSYLQWNNHPLGLDLFTGVMRRVTELIRPGVPIVVFGPHVPAHHQEIYALGADYVLLGEAELAVAALAESLALAGGPDGPVPGLVGRDEERLPAPAVVSDLDALPLPAYSQTVAYDYNAHNHPAEHGRGHLYECSRGCPYFCSFCNTVTHRRAHRVKSVPKIGADLAALAELTDRDYVYFIDESFGFRKDWFFALMPVLAELPLTYGCQGNLSFASPEKFDAMASAGFVNVEFGYETANEEVIKGLGKNNRVSASADLINRAADAGLSPVLFAQVGLPGESAQTLRESVAFLRRLRPEVRVSVALTTPYRETRLWREGVAAGQIPASLKGIDLYQFTGRVGHDLAFEQEAAERFADDFGPNHRLTPDFLDALEDSLTALFTL